MAHIQNFERKKSQSLGVRIPGLWLFVIQKLIDNL